MYRSLIPVPQARSVLSQDLDHMHTPRLVCQPDLADLRNNVSMKASRRLQMSGRSNAGAYLSGISKPAEATVWTGDHHGIAVKSSVCHGLTVCRTELARHHLFYGVAVSDCSSTPLMSKPTLLFSGTAGCFDNLGSGVHLSIW